METKANKGNVRVDQCPSLPGTAPVYACGFSIIINEVPFLLGNVPVWMINGLVTMVMAWARSHSYGH